MVMVFKTSEILISAMSGTGIVRRVPGLWVFFTKNESVYEYLKLLKLPGCR